MEINIKILIQLFYNFLLARKKLIHRMKKKYWSAVYLELSNYH